MGGPGPSTALRRIGRRCTIWQVPYDYFDCSNGVSVFPAEGKVIIFYSMLPNGEMDEMSLHGGCDVLEHDEKWSANFWLWNKPYHFMSPVRKRQAQELLDKAL